MVYLRYYWEFGDGKPYTEYTNNSEILTMILGVLMVTWVLVRRKSKEIKAEERLALQEGKVEVEDFMG